MEQEINLATLRTQTSEAAAELFSSTPLKPGMILVVGCSTSEIQGRSIGSAGSQEVAVSLMEALLEVCQKRGIALAVQCCEHLNRALVLERAVQERLGLPEVSVVPVLHAGGALATEAYRCFQDPVMVEAIQAHFGLDIGSTLIGMHIRPVAIPIRLVHNRIGRAYVTAARTRPKLIGGARACYKRP
jgi:uncharacterized protein (TIGR01440 family)